MSARGFHDVAVGIQGIALALALVVGGGWALYEFNALRTVEASRLEIERTRAELGRVFAQVRLSVEPLSVPSDSGCYVRVHARLENGSARRIRLAFEEGIAPLHVARVTASPEGGSVAFDPVASSPIYTFTASGRQVRSLPAATLDPGEVAAYPFVVRLDDAGLYFFQFTVPARVEPRAGEDPPEDEADAPTSWMWTGRSFDSCTPPG